MTAAAGGQNRFIVGARGSALSVAQAAQVIRSLKRRFPACRFEFKKITTLGDRSQDWSRDARGIFVKEIEDELLSGAIDMAVHSMKDLPSSLPKGACLAACVQKRDPRDALLSADGSDIMSLKKGALVGTTSLRRAAQLLSVRPDLKVENLRGNLDSRIRKLDEGLYDAIIVARAGLQRLNVRDPRVRIIPESLILPACGQGILGIETRARDRRVLRIARSLNDAKAFACVECERAFIAAAGGGCRMPVAVNAKIRAGKITLRALIISRDGKQSVRVKESSHPSAAVAMAKRCARKALDSGGREILAEIENEK